MAFSRESGFDFPWEILNEAIKYAKAICVWVEILLLSHQSWNTHRHTRVCSHTPTHTHTLRYREIFTHTDKQTRTFPEKENLWTIRVIRGAVRRRVISQKMRFPSREAAFQHLDIPDNVFGRKEETRVGAMIPYITLKNVHLQGLGVT